MLITTAQEPTPYTRVPNNAQTFIICCSGRKEKKTYARHRPHYPTKVDDHLKEHNPLT
jgi:hypothetical protein